jgi:phospholipid-binding lipoprotein MlaA
VSAPRPPSGLRRRLNRLAFGLLLGAAAGCATTGEADPRDPLEGLNRAVYAFNDGVDEVIAKPVATAYVNVVPVPVRERVRNFFGNIADLLIGVNNLLQGKLGDAGNDWARFVFNTTFGLFGIHDVATDMGFEKHNEDFGQTFGRWGAGNGPYIVLPFLGPSTLRDTVGTVLDIRLDPVSTHNETRERNSMIVLRLTSQRADLLEAGKLLEEAAFDKYVFTRDAYLQRRRSLIYDGSPPRERIPDARMDSPAATPRAASPRVAPVSQARAFGSYAPRLPANYEAVIAALDGAQR